MQVSMDGLSRQLIEYRKATRALMFFYDAAEALFNLIEKELDSLPPFKDKVESYSRFDVNIDDDEWEFPKNVSFEAFKSISEGINSWDISCCSEDDLRPRKNSILVGLFT
jgi:hypothetical protein